jgi:hypothetical protein
LKATGEGTEIVMDLNYLFLRQQVERSLAESARNAAARDAHEAMARAYEREIERSSGGRILFPWHHQGEITASRTPSASS